MLVPDIEVVCLSLIICWNYATRSYPILPYWRGATAVQVEQYTLSALKCLSLLCHAPYHTLDIQCCLVHLMLSVFLPDWPFHECIWSLGEIQDVLYNLTELPPGHSHSKCEPFSVSTQPAICLCKNDVRT